MIIDHLLDFSDARRAIVIRIHTPSHRVYCKKHIHGRLNLGNVYRSIGVTVSGSIGSYINRAIQTIDIYTTPGGVRGRGCVCNNCWAKRGTRIYVKRYIGHYSITYGCII